MTFFTRKLKFAAVGLTQSPRAAFDEIAHRVFPADKKTEQILRLREMTRLAPLILQIETVNVCNAACNFCAYKTMKREKGTMSMELFEKVVGNYAEMGGGPISLTPVGGDALLDKHLIDRIRVMEAHSAINQISLTTNAIALDRYSDEEVCYLLEGLDCIQVSIGGLDRATYETMYAVDRFEKVHAAMGRLLRLKALVAKPAAITFAFRTGDWLFEMRFRKELSVYRRQGVFISHIWLYANYSGRVQSDEKRNLMVVDGGAGRDSAANCLYGCASMAVCWNGRITACGCADIEADALPIGNAVKDSLADVWNGSRRLAIFDSFAQGNPEEICRNCSAYLPDTSVFWRAYFREFEAHRPLPLEFFHQFWGG